MRPYLRIGAATMLACACLPGAGTAWASESLSVRARFSPDTPNAPTNLSLTASFAANAGGPPAPVTKFVLYSPAGLAVDLHGAGTCAAETLEQSGPSGCPADSRAGFGGGVGVLALATETIREPYTLDFFFAAEQNGRLRLLVYARAVAPLGLELVVLAKQVSAPKPYGIGFSVEVPPISTFPGAPNASLESAFVTVGAPNVDYYKPVGGKRTLVHLRGLVVPKRCPRGGFPTEGIVNFADGTALTANSTIPCP